jgi:AcrR family transcriptional regulator
MSSKDLETRNLILEKTWKLLEKNRGQEVRIADIARAVGISRQAVYLHFPSRAQLLVAAVRYSDEVHKLNERLEGLTTAASAEVLDAYVDFWGNYIPEIYGLAKALLTLRETDKAAAAAWEDRMSELRHGAWCAIDCLARGQLLAPEWTVDQAADALWALSSIDVWENLTQARGWSNARYVERMKLVFKRTFMKSGTKRPASP